MQLQDRPVMLSPSDPRWLEFISSCSSTNIFHHPDWMELMHHCYGYSASVLAIFDTDGQICAGLPFMQIGNPLIGYRWVSLPFSDYCSPLSRDPAAAQKLYCQIVQIFQESHYHKMEVRWELPQCGEIQRVSQYVLHTIKLDPDPDQVARRVKRTHLQNIHTARERGVEVEFGNQLEHLKIFYRLQVETRKRHGAPAQPWKYFKLLCQDIIQTGKGFVLLARHEDEYIAGMVFLGWGNTLVAKYAASREDRFNLRPNNLLFWEGISWACKHGYTVFDMGRTELENTGLRTFKSRWGAVEQPLYYSVLSKKHYLPSNEKMMSILRLIIKSSPLWICQLIGELFYRYFG
jgi:hypothetical protein